MGAITGLKNSPRTGLWPAKFNIQSAQYIATIGQSEIVPLNHPIEINTLWFQLVYDIEHLNSQSLNDRCYRYWIRLLTVISQTMGPSY